MQVMASVTNRGSAASRRGFLVLVFAALLGAAAATGKAGQTSRSDATELAEGKVVYEQRCEICHYADSTAKKVGPGLKEMYPRGKFADGKKVDDSSVTVWIEKGGKDMPGYKDALKSEQVRALVAYLKSL